VREIAGVALQGLELVFGIRIGDARGAPHFLERLEQVVLLDAGPAEAPRRVASRFREGEEEVLRRDVLVTEFPGDLEGAVEDSREIPGDRRVRGGAGNLRLPFEVGLDVPGELLGARAELLEDRNDDAV